MAGGSSTISRTIAAATWTIAPLMERGPKSVKRAMIQSATDAGKTRETECQTFLTRFFVVRLHISMSNDTRVRKEYQ